MKKKSRIVSLGGVFSALCVIFLYLATYIPGNRLFFYSLSSIFVALVIIESGTGVGWLFYGATSVLSLLVIPNKIALIPYLLFFGCYGIVKYYIEWINILPLELIVKGVFFLICQVVLYIVYTRIFIIDIGAKIPIYMVFAIFLIIFYIYDYVYTRVIELYSKGYKQKKHFKA